MLTQLTSFDFFGHVHRFSASWTIWLDKEIESVNGNRCRGGEKSEKIRLNGPSFSKFLKFVCDHAVTRKR